MVKLFLEKTESVASVVEKIITSKDKHVVLVVPKNSPLKESVSNFHLLRREADAAKREILIETVDEEVLALAQMAKIDAVHSIFRKDRAASSFSDIVGPAAASTTVIAKGKGKKKTAESGAVEGNGNYNRDDDNDDDYGEASSSPRRVPVAYDEEEAPRRGRLVKVISVVAGVILLVIVGLWIFTAIFGRAEVVIAFTPTPWEFEDSFTADVAVSSADAPTNTLPAQKFTQDKNLTQLFAASGEDEVERKAAGTITIYNAFSSSDQPLVATTRFEAPDGKIYRITNDVVVPGAGVKDGVIVPSSIETGIAADKAGEAYNVGPIAKLTIPGFKGSPKFNGFYGEFKTPMKGGFVGVRPVPTKADVASAEAKVRELLDIALSSNIVNRVPDNFIILEEARRAEVGRISINDETDDAGNFSAFGKATFEAIGFKEEDFRSVVESYAQKSFPGKTIREITFEYENVVADFERGTLSFDVTARGLLQPGFSAEEFKAGLLGKSEGEARTAIGGLTEVKDARITLQPFWLRSIPARDAKVTLTVE